jgi:hypothetical protein
MTSEAVRADSTPAAARLAEEPSPPPAERRSSDAPRTLSCAEPKEMTHAILTSARIPGQISPRLQGKQRALDLHQTIRALKWSSTAGNSA